MSVAILCNVLSCTIIFKLTWYVTIIHIDCLCSQEHSSSSICAVYDGQCTCQASDSQLVDPVGRQCYVCPFYYYITNGGCSG